MHPTSPAPVPPPPNTDHPPYAPPQERGFFGRHKGHTLRDRQRNLMEHTLPRLTLPQPLPATLAALFQTPVTNIRLEIGFGGGEHLAAMVNTNPDVGYIGCEPFINGMAKLLAQLETQEQKPADQTPNIRLFSGDVSLLLPQIPSESLDCVDVFYPDPWPKRRHRKRRIISMPRLQEIARILRPNGTFRFISDIDDYTAWTLMMTAHIPCLQWQAENAAAWQNPWKTWVRTRYEAKALREGRTPSYLIFKKTSEI
jgi:tRNA (guanine-N7-)-methyltransferase